MYATARRSSKEKAKARGRMLKTTTIRKRKIAAKIASILETDFGLQSYLAFRIQSFEDIMTITKELESSDYYLFIDFRRDRNTPQEFEYSLFSKRPYKGISTG